MTLYRNGSKGEQVKSIQSQLKELGYYDGQIDGDFGSLTESSVREFQEAKGLNIDGIVGPQTWEYLFPLYRRGSKGRVVERIQTRLKELGYYLGPIDGIFGGGTENAVKSFQRENDLSVDGIVGIQTWKSLITQEEIHEPEILQKSLKYRCLALTGAFETGNPIPECFAGLSGDFDGQGISFGALQWNLGQGSLQPLLKEMNKENPEILEDIFDDYYPVLLAMLDEERDEQLAWSRSIQNNRFVLFEPWRGMFKTLGRKKEFQDIQVKDASQLYETAFSWCEEYEVHSERAVGLMFDIRIQNGSISGLVKAEIKRDFREIEETEEWQDEEVARLRIIANRRAEASNPRWIEDVRSRKLTIANGKGEVHGSHYELDRDYGIGLRRFEES